jgi:hypothetical protein
MIAFNRDQIGWKVRLSGPAHRIFLDEEVPLISAGMSLIVVGSISAVRHMPSSKLVARRQVTTAKGAKNDKSYR